jgi:hypothetical protein
MRHPGPPDPGRDAPSATRRAGLPGRVPRAQGPHSQLRLTARKPLILQQKSRTAPGGSAVERKVHVFDKQSSEKKVRISGVKKDVSRETLGC